MNAVDWVAVGVLVLALVRGITIGMVREAFSVAALAGACLAVRFGTEPAALWLETNADPGLGPLGARVLAGVAVGLATAVVVATIGRLVRRGVHAAGLGAADRMAGGVIGAAEGALVVGLGLLALMTLLGLEHPLIAESRTLATFQEVERVARGEIQALPDVAAPPPSARR